jgi:hypothetical protein
VERGFALTPERKGGILHLLMEEKRLPDFGRAVDHVSYADGCKVYFERDAWVIARPSGTEPRIRVFAEAEDAEEAARLASEGGYDYFTTTLSISPLKNAAMINRIGLELEQRYGVKHLPSDFKKKGGYQRSIVLSKEHGLYRQDYCGCVFSKAEREREKRIRSRMESD